MNRTAIAEEQTKLTQVINYIENELARQRGHVGSDVLSRKAIRELDLSDKERIKSTRQRPFFGRIDWRDAEAGEETYYIGFECLASQKIFAWQDTKVADMYYQQATDAEIKVVRRRAIEINDDHVIHVIDLDGYVAGEQAYTDTYLQTLLDGPRTAQMHDIVATIQAEQYTIMSADHTRPLVVQGAPGSGKSVVALHRISYLAYHEKIDAARTLILAPTPLFLNYIRNVLPELGNKDVQQRTYDQWVQDQLGEKLNYLPQETSLERLLAPQQPPHEKYITYRTAKIKGSMRMAQLLEQYVAILREDMRSKLEPLTIDISSIKGLALAPAIMLTKAQIEAFVEQTMALPLNKQRAEIEVRLVKHLLTRDRLTLNPEQTQAFETLVAKAVHAHFDSWKALNVAVGYRRLFRNRDYLYAASKQLAWTVEELELLHHSAPKQTTPFQFADLPGLLYLQQLLNGLQAAYSHIVIDEAQDVSPLFLHMLGHCCGDSMTLLGDVNQGIFEHQGLQKWEEVVEPEQIKYLTQSYRSTPEIVAQANRLLSRVAGQQVSPVQAIKRSGSQVELKQVSSYRATLNALMRLASLNIQRSVAILLPNSAACQQLHTDLFKAGVSIALINNRETLYSGGHVIMPIGLAKGLEFDIVVVPNVDHNTFPADRLHARLLYVAMTRAAKELHLWFSHAITPLLEGYLPQLEPLLAGILEEPALTIHEYTQRNADLPVDDILLSLARKKILGLLHNGRVAPALLEALALEDKAPKENEEEEAVFSRDSNLPTNNVRSEPKQHTFIKYGYDQATLATYLTEAQSSQRLALSTIQLVYTMFKADLEALSIHVYDAKARNSFYHVIGLAHLLEYIEQHPEYQPLTHVTRKDITRYAGSEDGQRLVNRLGHLKAYGCVNYSLNKMTYSVEPSFAETLIRYALGLPTSRLRPSFADILQKIEQPLISEVSQEVSS